MKSGVSTAPVSIFPFLRLAAMFAPGSHMRSNLIRCGFTAVLTSHLEFVWAAVSAMLQEQNPVLGSITVTPATSQSLNSHQACCTRPAYSIGMLLRLAEKKVLLAQRGRSSSRDATWNASKLVRCKDRDNRIHVEGLSAFVLLQADYGTGLHACLALQDVAALRYGWAWGSVSTAILHGTR